MSAVIKPSAKSELTYPGFLRRSISVATDGPWTFYVWMLALTAVALVGVNAWAVQVRDGMIQTNMSDHVTGDCILRTLRSAWGWPLAV